MQIIGVLDLLGGRAVHARAGARDRYAPVQNAAGWPIDPGNARTLAGVYLDLLGISEIYAADLDAILDRPPQDAVTSELASLGAPLWLDAGIRSVDEARRATAFGGSRVVVGLETLPSFDVLAAICAAVGGDRVAFSLDLRNGRPVVMRRGSVSPEESVETLILNAVLAGVGAVIVIDLARVGTGAGVDLAVLDQVRASAPGLTLIAGGGVRGWDDLARLAQAGCSGALVATALHDGSIDASHITAARSL